MPTDQCFSRPVPSLGDCQTFPVYGIKLGQRQRCYGTHLVQINASNDTAKGRTQRSKHAWGRLSNLQQFIGPVQGDLGIVLSYESQSIKALTQRPYGVHTSIRWPCLICWDRRVHRLGVRVVPRAGRWTRWGSRWWTWRWWPRSQIIQNGRFRWQA